MTKTPGKQNPEMGRPNMATRNELNAFLAQLGTLKKDVKNEEDIKQREVIRSYLQQFDRQELQRLMGRAFADALKSPSQKLGTAKPPSEAPRPRKKQPTAKRNKRPNKKRRRPSRRGAAR
jgi:hypothetical protein